jgi:hypothetical protein
MVDQQYLAQWLQQLVEKGSSTAKATFTRNSDSIYQFEE